MPEPEKLTVEEYCAKLEEWADIMRGRYIELESLDTSEGSYPQGKDFLQHLNMVILAIRKSSLLNRMMYGGQKPRTQKCDLHRGKWSGLHFERPDWNKWEPLGKVWPACNCWEPGTGECSGWVPETLVEGPIGNQPVLMTFEKDPFEEET